MIENGRLGAITQEPRRVICAQRLYESPLGALLLSEDGCGLCRIDLHPAGLPQLSPAASPCLEKAALELDAYFAGERKGFTVPVSLQGTAFQLAVWRALMGVPYGQTCSYGDLAVAVGSPLASRAVGMANHYNPVMIIVPCHRVIGKDGSLVGYGGGLDIKRALLSLEKEHTLK